MYTLSRRQLAKGWRLEKCDGIIYGIGPDGLTIHFTPDDIVGLLDKNYPHDDRVWWFNETRDREIAEKFNSEIVCNPQVLYQNFSRNYEQV